MARIALDGKQFALDGRRFPFRGVTYGTFAPREDGALFPERAQVKRDFATMRERAFTVVRTYTVPPDDVVELAADWGLHLLVDVFYPDWRYLVGASRRQQRAVARAARDAVRQAARRFAGTEQVLALNMGNEIPADVIRWVGTRTVAGVVDQMVTICREEDPDLLVTYANYPTAEYLPLHTVDFLTLNVFLEREHDFRRYLNRLHNLAGDRPLVLGEVGLDSGGTPGGERHQADVLDWQLRIAVERGVAGTCLFSWTDEWNVGGGDVEGWHFGLTRVDRTPRPALDVAEQWNHRTVRDLDHPWPRISVVICAYNAEPYLDECLRHTTALDYPDLEIVVVDDGSADRTAEIARRHPRVRLVQIDHGGLSVARNEGFRAATGDLIAYLDSDAFPTPEWPYFLALGLDGKGVAGVGGPNVPPRDDPAGAHVVARAPGGPVHVLTGDDRAEHVPGCNMAFWRYVLTEVGGFDPIYTAAGDDVDVCWKVLDRGLEIGFHPAALVWHRRRPSVRAYLQQQRGYGRAEALVEARHPERFTQLGTARWRGHIYASVPPPARAQRVYRGQYGSAAFQSVYRGGGHFRDVVQQAGVPLAAAAIATTPLGLVNPAAVAPAVAGLLVLAGVFTVEAARTTAPPGWRGSRTRFRTAVALLHVLQPLARLWGRLQQNGSAHRRLDVRTLPGPATDAGRGVLLLPEEHSRAALAPVLLAHLRRGGFRVRPPTGWEAYDAAVGASFLFAGEVVTSAHPPGCIQVRIRPRLRRRRVAVAGCGALAAAVLQLSLLPALAAAAAVDAGWALWRLRAMRRRVVGASG